MLANNQALARDLVAMLDTADSLFAREQLANLLGDLGDPAALPCAPQQCVLSVAFPIKAVSSY